MMTRAVTSLACLCSVVVVFATGCQATGRKAGGDELAEGAWPAPEPKVFVCHRVTEAITIDGKLDESVYTSVEPITAFRQPASLKPPSAPSRVWLLWDETNLYLAGKLRDKDVYAMMFGHDEKTWFDDALELFVKPSDASYVYYEFHVTPRGATLDLMFPRRGAGTEKRFWGYTSGMQAAATVQGTLNVWQDEDEGWTAEMAIPLTSLVLDGRLPKAGDTWKVAVCRYNYSVHLPPGPIGGEALELSSTARFPKVRYHLYEYYDVLRFE